MRGRRGATAANRNDGSLRVDAVPEWRAVHRLDDRGIAGGFVGGGEDRLQYLEDLLTSPGSLRVHANWFQVNVTGLDDSVMLNGLIDTTQKDANHLDSWIAENGSTELGF